MIFSEVTAGRDFLPLLAVYIQPGLVTTHPVSAAPVVGFTFSLFFFSSLFLFLFFLSPLALFFSSPASPVLYLHLFLFLSLHLFESISVAATEEPAATVAWFPALWQKVTLSLAAWKKGRGDAKVEGEEGGDGWMDVAIETD